MLLLLLPIFTFNYLLYKDKKILDLQFARISRQSLETYSSIGATIESFSAKALLFNVPGHEKPGFLVSLNYLYQYETLIILILAFMGLVFLFRSKSKFRFLLAATFAVPFLFLSGTSLLPNHFVFMSYYACLLGALGLHESSKYLKADKHKKILIYAVFIILIISSYVFIEKESVSQGLFGGKNELGLVVDYKDKNIGESSLVVADARIYTGQVVFMFWDRNYLLANDFIQIINNMDQLPGETVQTEVYFLECVIDDCGWGGGQVSGEFNSTMESLTAEFKRIGSLEATIDDVYSNKHFNVYKAVIGIKTSAFDISRANKKWFYYPVNYEPKSEVFDNYNTSGFIDPTLDKIAHAVMYAEVLIALMYFLIIFYLLFKKG